MFRDEIKTILSVLKAGYPNFYKDLKKDDSDQIINLWAAMFSDDSAEVVTEAVKSLMCTLKFPPTIADVKEKIALLTQPKFSTELEAWNKVFAAIKDSNYHSKERFDELPVNIQKIIGSHNQLREWAMMESDVVNSVIQSNFMRSFKANTATEKEFAMLPESAKQLQKNFSESIEKKLLK
jgi:hypothetical protein